MSLAIAPEEYRQRRDRVMQQIGQGTAIVASAPVAVMHHDVEYPYRQDSDFFYLTGFNEPEAIAVLCPHHPTHRFILFVQPKDPLMETWTGYRAGVETAQERYGADIAYPIEELAQQLPQYIEAADRLYYHLGRHRACNQTVLHLWRKQIANYARKGYGPIAIEDPGPLLHEMRLIKSEGELTLLREAIAISAEAHRQAQEIARPGMYEYEIQGEMERIFRQRGGMGPAYPSIVASGPNACILHYIENQRCLQDGDLLLIDAGCCYGYYNGDITRTFPVNGRFSPEQKALYEIVLAAQKAAIAAVQPGRPYNDFHQAAVLVLVEGLVDLGLLEGDPKDLVAEEAYKPFYMHRTGHWLGLDVHDAGSYRQGPGENAWRPLQPGQVVTVEPGLYISPQIEPAPGQPDIPHPWRGLGIRIEDDLLVTSGGHENLTIAVPKEGPGYV